MRLYEIEPRRYINVDLITQINYYDGGEVERITVVLGADTVSAFAEFARSAYTDLVVNAQSLDIERF